MNMLLTQSGMSQCQYQHCKPLLAFLHTYIYTGIYANIHNLKSSWISVGEAASFQTHTTAWTFQEISGSRVIIIFFTPQRRKIRLKMQHESPSHPPSTECSLLADTCYLWKKKTWTEFLVSVRFTFSPERFLKTEKADLEDLSVLRP